jgi:hypothetical protein
MASQMKRPPLGRDRAKAAQQAPQALQIEKARNR